MPKLLDDLLVRLGIPSLRKASIALDWSATPVGFSPAGNVKFAVDPVNFRLAAFQSQALRLMNFEQGAMLTAPVALSALGGCTGDISAVALSAEGGLHVETPTCFADRAPPPPLESLLAKPDPRLAIAPVEVEGEARLPGEAMAPAIPSPPSPPAQ